MKKWAIITLCICIALLTFSACSKSTTPSSSEDTIPSQSESAPPNIPPSENDNSSMADEAQSNVNISSSISEPPESQESQSSSSESSSPSSIQTVIEPDSTTVYIELSSNTITLNQIDNSFQVPYKIYNNSSKEIHLAPNYEIEKHNGSEWIPFPFSELDAPNWPSVVYSISADSVSEANLSYWVFEEEMTLGTYRMVKHVGEEGKEWLTIYAKFSVVE